MTKILLTGAGFTRNWGGWLASEAFEYLLQSRELDAALRRELWSDKNRGLGFEATLDRLQQEAQRHDPGNTVAAQVNTLSSALRGMFTSMDEGLKSAAFEFNNDLKFSVGAFLARFDAIFSLNLDLLLERRYLPGVNLIHPGKWDGAYSPGIGGPIPGFNYDAESLISAQRRTLPAEFALRPRIQPYFKLHGSQNWIDDAGGRMLIMGGNKAAAIGSHPILKCYAEKFDEYLNRGDTKLMVIGYGFGDPHINEALKKAVANELRIFIIDPAGTDVLETRRRAALGHLTDDLMDALQLTICGASRRALRTTFGGDAVEHSRVMEFFKS